MTATPFVPFRLTVCGIDELAGHCEAGVSHVLSIMDPGWDTPPSFGRYGEHVRLDLRFDDAIDPVPGQLLPTESDVQALLAFGRELVEEARERPDTHLLVHCHAGISRSTASMALILAQARPDRPPADALAEVVRIRPVAWPNLRLIEIGDGMLGLDGRLVAAARDRYAEMVKADSARIDFYRRHNRGRELAHIQGI